MRYFQAQFTHCFPKISLCDARIDTIMCLDNCIRFVFPSGFSVISGDKVEASSYGYVEISDCEPDDFNCHIIQREPTPTGTRLHGEPISLVDLANLLKDEQIAIELYLELYDFNYFHWRGVLLPYKAQGLSDNVLIETSGCFQLTFFWEH